LAAFLLFLIAVPALAQDDFPRLEIGFGYANITLPGALQPDGTTGGTTHNSGFSMQTDLNFTKILGIENYTGYYSLGNGAQLFANVMCAKAAYRNWDKIVPYAVAGIGAANSLENINGLYYSAGSGFATKLGVGVDYRFSDIMAFRVDAGRLQVHSPVIDPFSGIQTGSTWLGKFNFTTGIVLTIMQ
jgi:hypothetical protein